MTSTDNAGDEGELPRRLRRMVNLRGLSRVSAELGISRESLARYLARLDVQAGTLALIESKLSAPLSTPSGLTAPWGVTPEREAEMLAREDAQLATATSCPEGYTDWTCSRGYTHRIALGATGVAGVGPCPRCGSTDRNYRPVVAGVVCDQPWHDEPEVSKGGADALPR